MNKFLFVLFFLILNSICLGQTVNKSGFIIKLNGDTLWVSYIEQGKSRVYYKLGKKEKEKEIRVDSILQLFDAEKRMCFEPFYFENENKIKLMAKISEGDIILYGEEGSGGLSSYGSINHEIRRIKIWINLHFRHSSEIKDIIHPVNKLELESKSYYYCPSILKESLSKINESKLRGHKRDEVYYELIRMYNINCEAQKREEKFNQK